MNEVVFSGGSAAVAARYSGDGGDSLAGAMRGFRKVMGFRFAPFFLKFTSPAPRNRWKPKQAGNLVQ